MLGEIRGACANHQTSCSDPACDQRAIGERAHPHGEVIALGDDVDDPHAGVEINRDLRVCDDKLGQGGGNKTLGINAGSRDAYQPLGLLLQVRHVLLERIEPVQDLAAALVVDAPHVGQPHSACRAVQKTRVEALLETFDLAADKGRRHTEDLGRGREAAVLHYRNKLTEPRLVRHYCYPAKMIQPDNILIPCKQ